MGLVLAVQPDNGMEAIPLWCWALFALVILAVLVLAVASLMRQRPTR